MVFANKAKKDAQKSEEYNRIGWKFTSDTHAEIRIYSRIC